MISVNGKIVARKFFRSDSFFDLSNSFEYGNLEIPIAKISCDKCEFIRTRIGIVGRTDTENRIWRKHGDLIVEAHTNGSYRSEALNAT